MGTFLIGMIIYAAVIIVPFVAYMLVVNHLIWKRLQKHQNEWNEIKKSLPNDFLAVDNAYWEYCDKLWAERHPTLGACFPKK